MKTQFLISEEEKKRILSVHETATKNLYLNLITEEAIFNPKTEAIQKKLTELGYGKTVGDIDGKYGQKTACAVAKFQINNKLTMDGKVGKNTAAKLGVEPYFPKDINIKACQGLLTTSPKNTNGDLLKRTDEKCESIPQDFCKLVDSSSEKSIGDGGTEGCAQFVTKFLDLGYMGDAWTAFNVVKKYGVKYNMFTDGGINWDNVRKLIKSGGINSQTCGCYTEEGEGKDKTCGDGSKISKLISSFYPTSSGVNLNNLKLGDVVGMYWKNSGNKGKAFCTRAVARGIGPDGSVKDTDPFTFNTHVGYVGAIKNGVPIIFHSVHGTRLATPANQLLSSSGNGMITWVTGGPKSEVKKELEPKNSTWLDTFSDLFGK